MSQRIGGVVIDVDARLTSIEKELQKAGRELARFEKASLANAKNIETGFGKIGAGITTLGASLAGLGLAVGLSELASFGRSALAMGDDLATAADQALIGVERFQTLRQAFRELEVDGDQFDKSMMRLVTTLGEVQSGATSGATAALDKMGITARILSGEIDQTDELLDAIAASATRFGSEAEFTAAVVDIFGRKVGVQMAAALRDGGTALHSIERDVKRVGTVLTEEQINRLADANEVIDRFTETAAYRFAIWASKSIEAIESVGDTFTWLMDMADRANIATAEFFGGEARDSKARVAGRIRAASPNDGSDVSERLGFNVKPVAQVAAPIARPRGGGGGGAPRRSSGGGGGIREADSFARIMAELARRTEDARMEYTALNEQWSDVAILDAEMRTASLRQEQEQGARWTELQRSQFRAASDDLRKLAIDTRLAEINQRALNDAILSFDPSQFDGAANLESDLARIAADVPDLRNIWQRTFGDMDDLQRGVFDDLARNLEGAILGFGSLEDAAEGFAKQLLSMALQAFVFAPLGKALKIPGYADGTNSAPGGLALVGERGPELVNLPRGAQVIPTNRLMAMQNSKVNAVGGGGPTNVTVNVTVPAGVDLATRGEVVRLADATKRATLDAIKQQQRRSPR